MNRQHFFLELELFSLLHGNEPQSDNNTINTVVFTNVHTKQPWPVAVYVLLFLQISFNWYRDSMSQIRNLGVTLIRWAKR